MEKKKAKMGMSAMLIVGILFFLMGIIFLPTGIGIYLAEKEFMGEAIIFLITFGGTGLIFSVLGLIFLIISINKKLRCDRLLQEGNYIMAEVMEITRNLNVRINNRHPFIVKCCYQDGYGNLHIFKSRNLLFDPSIILKDNMVRVYVDGQNYNHYYVDIDEALPNVIEH